jgi:hypothetical protein
MPIVVFEIGAEGFFFANATTFSLWIRGLPSRL